MFFWYISLKTWLHFPSDDSEMMINVPVVVEGCRCASWAVMFCSPNFSSPTHPLALLSDKRSHCWVGSVHTEGEAERAHRAQLTPPCRCMNNGAPAAAARIPSDIHT